MSKTTVSMKDVAEHAGVSKATVSKALNNKPDISDSVRQRVFAACEALNYRLNPNVQDLLKRGINGRTQDIALVLEVSAFANPAYAAFVEGIAQGAEEHGLHFMLCKLNGKEDSIYELPPSLRDHRVAGVLISGDLRRRTIELLQELKLPHVILGNYGRDIVRQSPCIELDASRMMYLCIEKIKQAGRTRVAYFLEDPSSYYADTCLREFRLALELNGLPFHPELVYTGQQRAYNAFTVMQRAFEEEALAFDSLVCLNYTAAQEIACLAVAYFGWERAAHLVVATISTYQKELPVSALYFDRIGEKLAHNGVTTLVGLLDQQSTEGRSILITPELSDIQPPSLAD